jgi:oligopeptidase A
LSELGNQYSNNVRRHHGLDEADYRRSGAGRDAGKRAGGSKSRPAKELDGFLLTLDIPSYLPVMTYCDNQALREEMYRAYSTRASDQGPKCG